jgi:hypothetical protein
MVITKNELGVAFCVPYKVGDLFSLFVGIGIFGWKMEVTKFAFTSARKPTRKNHIMAHIFISNV